MFAQAFKAALGTIKRKPLMLWGLSLLSGIICTIATFAAGTFAFIGIAFGYVISVGMAKVYLDGLEGKQVNSDQLFSGFTGGRVFRVAGGMAWRTIWSVIWTIATVALPFAIFALFALIGLPLGRAAIVTTIIGVVLAVLAIIPAAIIRISKTYSYAFVPYILATQPDVTATQALRLSMKLTKGKKLQMWLADLLYSVITGFITAIIFGLGAIPYIGFVFMIAAFAWVVVLFVFGPLFKGLYAAEFYRMPAITAVPQNPTFDVDNILNKVQDTITNEQ